MMIRYCLVCGEPLEQPAVGRKRRYCSNACKQKDYRELRKWAHLAVDCALEGKPEPPKDWRYWRYRKVSDGDHRLIREVS